MLARKRLLCFLEKTRILQRNAHLIGKGLQSLGIFLAKEICRCRVERKKPDHPVAVPDRRAQIAVNPLIAGNASPLRIVVCIRNAQGLLCETHRAQV
jgi:hypothetical protein